MVWTETPQEACQNTYLTWRSAEDVLRDARLMRAERDAEGRLAGFQRQPIQEHVRRIAARLSKPGAQLRNPVTVGLADGHAWIVDGQQRLLACVEADHGARIPVLVIRAGSLDELRAEFVTVNDARPLPAALIAEILTGIGDLPEKLGDGTLALLLVEALNHQPGSPLRGLIRRPTNSEGILSDAALVRGLSTSLRHGALAHHGGQKEQVMTRGLALVESFFEALIAVFKRDWDGMNPRRSRLVHGAGIAAALHMMDEIHAQRGATSREDFTGPLLLVRPHCRWTSGMWEFHDGVCLAWDGVQNVPAHRVALSHHVGLLLTAALQPARTTV